MSDPAGTGTITRAHTGAALSSSINPSSTGQSVTFTASVTVNSPGAGTPTGTVTFEDNDVPIGTGVLNGGGMATFATTGLSEGSHLITAVYGGDNNFTTTTSPVVTQVVSASMLQVATFISMNTGFTASFNRSLDVGTPANPFLNLETLKP